MVKISFGAPEDFEQDQSLTNDLLEIGEGLNEREMEFVESVAKQVQRGQSLSDAQRRIAKEILERLG